MSIHFHKLKIKEVRQETADCVSIAFEIPENLVSQFEFRQGQNITLRTFINQEDVRRSYSICAAPFEKELRIAVKKVDQGLFSGFAHDHFRAGDEVEVLPPTGKFFTRLDAGQKKNYLAFAAGSGITPLLSIVKTTLREEPLSRFTLVYSNRSKSSIIFLEALEALKNQYFNRFVLIHILSREQTDAPLNSGRLNREKLDQLQRLIDYSSMDELFICGPEAMIFTIRDYLIEKKIAREKIHFELFNTTGSSVAALQVRESLSDEKSSSVTIKLDGRSFGFELAFQGDSVLDAALKTGADLPYACKGGVCASCRAKLLEGQVTMDMNWALEAEEVAQGFILTCQSHPTTEKVTIDFDSR